MHASRPTDPPAAEHTVRLTDRFGEALRLAFELHREQRRKGSGIPYLAHLLAVAALVIEDGGDEDEAIAALLHDAVEDHGDRITLAEIETRFGSGRVAAIVRDCTDTDPVHRGGDKGPWMPRKQRYIEHLRSRPPSLRVPLADKLHNPRSILADHERLGDAVFDRFTATREETLWYCRALVRAFRDAGVRGRMIEELDRTVSRCSAASPCRGPAPRPPSPAAGCLCG